MHCVVEFNDKDIQKLIAEVYDVLEEDVFVSVQTETEGYGMSEHEVSVPTATVIFRNKYPSGVDHFRVIEEEKNE